MDPVTRQALNVARTLVDADFDGLPNDALAAWARYTRPALRELVRHLDHGDDAMTDYPHFRVRPHTADDGTVTFTVSWHPDPEHSPELLGEGLDGGQALDLLDTNMFMRPWLDDGSLT